MPGEHQDLLGEHYRIIRPLEGGSGKWVYLAHDLRALDRLCVLVEIVDQLGEPTAQARAMAAFEREAELIAGLRNRHLPALYAWFHQDRHHYFATEFIAGQSLAARLAEAGGRLDQGSVIELALQLVDGLEALHGTRPPVVFENLGPSSVIITPGGRLYLIDYPLERHFAAQPHVGARMEDYAPAEQYAGLSEPRSDLYSLGALMYQALAGQPPARNSPFVYSSAKAVRAAEPGRVRSLANARRVAVRPPLRELCPQCAPELAELITQALEPEIERRPADAAQMRARLQSLQSRLPAPELSQAPVTVYGSTSVVSAGAEPGDDRAQGPMAAREIELRLRELVGEALAAALSTLSCPHCARRVQAGASYCPFCGQALGAPALMAPVARARELANRNWRQWWGSGVALAGLVWVLAMGVYYLGFVRHSTPALSPPHPISAATRATPAMSADSRAVAQLLQDAAKLQKLPAGSAAQADLREDLILRAARLTPPPPLPPKVADLIDRGEAELRAASSPDEYKRAAVKLDQALRSAPWMTSAYLPLAQALAQSGNRDGAIAAYKNYLLAPPKGSDLAAVRSALLDLQNGNQTEVASQEEQTSPAPDVEAVAPPAPITISQQSARLPKLAGYWYRTVSGMAAPSSAQRIKISQAGAQIRLQITDDCGRASCAPGSDAWRPHQADPNDPLSDYGGRYVLSGQSLSFGPHQWRLPAELGNCVITTRRLGDISPDDKAMVIRTVNSGSKCRLYQGDIHLWRP